MRRFVSIWLAAGLILAGLTAARGSDASLFGILKAQLFVQTNEGSPYSPVTNGFRFDCFVFETTNGSVTSASLTTSVSGTPSLLPQSSPPNFLFEQYFNTSSALDIAYPSSGLSGNYTVTMHGANDGTRSAALSFSTFFTYPQTPQITGFLAAQSIDTTMPFTFTWTQTGGQSSDLVQLSVQDASSNVIFSTPFPSVSGALNGLSNSATVAANVLPPGTNLIAHLSVGRPAGVNSNSYLGATGVAIFGKGVEFPVVTRPGPLMPRMTIAGRGFPVQLQFSAETNRNYHLESSSNLVNWADLLVTNMSSGTNVMVTDTNSSRAGRKYYRVQVGP